jgi:hypothetical protein
MITLPAEVGGDHASRRRTRRGSTDAAASAIQ